MSKDKMLSFSLLTSVSLNPVLMASLTLPTDRFDSYISRKRFPVSFSRFW